jgi:hypothetical protein
MVNRISSCLEARLPRRRAADFASLVASKARWLSGGYRGSCCHATVAALLGRVAPRGDDDPFAWGKVGRASVAGRVELVGAVKQLLSLRLAASLRAAGDGELT